MGVPGKVQNDKPSAEFMSAIIEHLAHPIFVKDRHYRFVVINRAFTALCGFSREEMIGKSDYDFFPREQADFFRAKDEEMFHSAAVVQIEEEPITDSDGHTHILATTKVPYRNEVGEVTHLIGIIKDITDLKQAEAMLRDANEELERRVAERTQELAMAQRELLRKERLAVLGQLAGGLAHQLRNPLAAIQNAVALLRRPDSDGAAQALGIIDEEVRRADHTIRDLLDYAAIRPARRVTVVVAELIDQVVDLEGPHDDVKLEIRMTDDAAVWADASQVVAALGNIYRNAVEAVDQLPNREVHIIVSGEAEHVRITVADSGEGVPVAAKDTLFEPLVTTKAMGIGLGLSIARSLIQNQGGDIRVDTSPLGGAAFVVRLPKAGSRTQSKEPENQASQDA